ncbi:hypothetical protein [Streptomyces sp. NPDC058718]|uniref:hypothetical protein n=1 Tax=Streptomyces sp. NPDC058718 TaxID=3346610 RepID=UPI0036B32D9E
MNADGGGRVDAKSGHGAIKHLGPLVRQVRHGEERAGLQAVELRCARQCVTYQERPQVRHADPGVAGRQVDADAQQMAADGGNLHEVAGTGVDDTQHAAEGSRGNPRHRGGPDQALGIGAGSIPVVRSSATPQVGDLGRRAFPCFVYRDGAAGTEAHQVEGAATV